MVSIQEVHGICEIFGDIPLPEMKPHWSGCAKPKSGTLEMALIKHVCRETGLNNALGERALSFVVE